MDDFVSSKQRKGHVKPNPDRPGQHSFTTLLKKKKPDVSGFFFFVL
jgi:hypothetical protein